MESIAFVKQFPLREFKKGELLLSEGDPTDVLLAIQTGYVKVTSIDVHGSQRLLSIAGRYDVVPAERLFTVRGSLRFFYTALCDGTAYRVDKQAFLAQALSHPELMTEVARGVSNHYDDLLDRIESGSHLGVHDKLAGILTYIAERFSAEPSIDLYKKGLKLTHQDFAEMIGATRETTSLAMRKLLAEGLIDYSHGHFIIHTKKISARLLSE